MIGSPPYLELLKTLSLLVGPLILGLLCRRVFPNQAIIAAKILSPLTFLVSLVIVLLNFFKYYTVAIITFAELVSCAIYTPMAALICYSITMSLHLLTRKRCNSKLNLNSINQNTIAIETVVQNVVVGQLVVFNVYANDLYVLAYVVIYPALILLISVRTRPNLYYKGCILIYYFSKHRFYQLYLFINCLKDLKRMKLKKI